MIWVVSLVGAVGVVAILFIINLLRAPYEIAQEDEQRMTSEIEALKLRLSEAGADYRKLVANETIACGMRALDLGRELSLINAEFLEAKAQKPEGPHPGPLLKFAGMRRQSESVLLRLDRLGVPIPSVAKMNLDAQWPDLRRISRLESYLKEVGVLLLDGNIERAKEIALTRTAFIDEADAG